MIMSAASIVLALLVVYPSMVLAKQYVVGDDEAGMVMLITKLGLMTKLSNLEMF